MRELSFRGGVPIVGIQDRTERAVLPISVEVARQAVARVRAVGIPKASHSFTPQPRATIYSLITDAENEKKMEKKFKQRAAKEAKRDADLNALGNGDLEDGQEPSSKSAERVKAKLKQKLVKTAELNRLLTEDAEAAGDPDYSPLSGVALLGQLGYEGLTVNRATLATVISRMRTTESMGAPPQTFVTRSELVLAQAAQDCINSRSASKVIFERWASRGQDGNINLKGATRASYDTCGVEIVQRFRNQARHTHAKLRKFVMSPSDELIESSARASFQKTMSLFGPSVPLSESILNLVKNDSAAYTVAEQTSFAANVLKTTNAHYCGVGDVQGQATRLMSVMSYQLKTKGKVNELMKEMAEPPAKRATIEQMVAMYLKIGEHYFTEYNKVGDIGDEFWSLVQSEEGYKPVEEWVESLTTILDNGDRAKLMDFNLINLDSQAGPGYGNCSKGDVLHHIMDDATANYENFDQSIDSVIGLTAVLAERPEAGYVYLKPKNEPYKYRTNLGMDSDFTPSPEWLDECREDNIDTEKVRTIYVGNSGITYELGLVSNVLFKSAPTCFSNRGELMQSEIFSMHGFGATAGNIDLFCRRVQCIKPFNPKIDQTERFVTGYSDNAYMCGELSQDFDVRKYDGLMENVVAPQSMQHLLQEIKATGVIPARTRCMFSIDGKRMESSVDYITQAAAMKLFCDAIRAPFEKRRYYTECVLPLMAKPKGLFGVVEVDLEMNTSGNPLTFYNNDFKMFCIIQEYVVNHPDDLEIDPENLIALSERLGTFLTIERVVLLPEIGQPLVVLGESLDIDLLGNSITGVAMENPFDDTHLIVGTLEPARFYKALCFDRTEGRLTILEESAASKAISLFVSSGANNVLVLDVLTQLVIDGRNLFLGDHGLQESLESTMILNATGMTSELKSCLSNLAAGATVTLNDFSSVKNVLMKIFKRVNAYPSIGPSDGVISARVGPELFGGTYNVRNLSPATYTVASQASRFIRQLNVLVALPEGSFNGALRLSPTHEVISYEPTKADLSTVKELYTVSGFVTTPQIVRNALNTAMRIKPQLAADYRDAVTRSLNYEEDKRAEVLAARARKKAIEKAVKEKRNADRESAISSIAERGARENLTEVKSVGLFSEERAIMSLKKSRSECVEFDSLDPPGQGEMPLSELKSVVSFINSYTNSSLMAMYSNACLLTARDLHKTKVLGKLKTVINSLPFPDEISNNLKGALERARSGRTLETCEMCFIPVGSPSLSRPPTFTGDEARISIDLNSLFRSRKIALVRRLRDVEESMVFGPLCELMSLNLAIIQSRVGLSSFRFDGSGDVWCTLSPGGLIPPELQRAKSLLSSSFKFEIVSVRAERSDHFDEIPASMESRGNKKDSRKQRSG